MRKRLAVFVLILLGVPVAGTAQAPSFGLRGGLNMADFGGSRIVDSDSRAGFILGAFASIPIRGAVSIQPEVIFSQRGANRAAYNYDDMPVDTDAPPIGVYLGESTSHDYLEVPLLLRISPSTADNSVRPIFFAGPSVGFLVSTKEVYDTDYSEYLNSTDIGVVFGGGVDYGRVSLDARYNLGLTTVDRDFDASWGHVPGSVKNRAFTVTAGFRLF